MLTHTQLSNLHAKTLEFVLSINWEEPLEGEREPEYTSRVLGPAVASFVADLNHRTLILRHDGEEVPLPVVVDGQKFVPDMAVSDGSSRELAIEVKYLNASSYSDQLTKAIGQAFIYRSFGYRASLVILVSRNGSAVLAPSSLKHMNESLGDLLVGIAQLAI